MTNRGGNGYIHVQDKGKTVMTRQLPSMERYRELLAKLDGHGERLLRRYGDRIVCGEGCAECCTLSSVSGIEAYGILGYARGLSKLREREAPRNREKNGHGGAGGAARRGPRPCPFLTEDRCIIYPARPVICRTHGYPLLIEKKVDFCPKNFVSLDAIDSGFILDLERLNTLISSLNIMFLRETGDPFFRKERVAMTELFELAFAP